MKKPIIFAIIVIVLVVVIFQSFFKKEKAELGFAEVERGNVVQEVSETGQVQKGDKINLSFENTGKISRIYVKVGENVNKGKLLAQLETDDLELQLLEAKAALDVAQANLDKLLAGAGQEEIKVAQTAVANAWQSLREAETNLQDVESIAQETIAAAYEDALNALEDAYLKAYNARNTVDAIQRTYFVQNDQEGIAVRAEKDKIAGDVAEIKSSLDGAKGDPSQENIDVSLSQTKSKLSSLSGSLRTVRDTCEASLYRDSVSAVDKTSLDTHRASINTVAADITNGQQTISSTKLNNASNVNIAKAAVSKAEGVYASAEDELGLLLAPPRQEDIDLYQAQLEQAQTQVQVLENGIRKASLYSPAAGQITSVEKKSGEIVSAALKDAVLVLLPASPYEIKVDIYEEDVVKMNIGNPVEINLVAFPNETFRGEMISIDPAEKLVDGVVYYETVISFSEMPEGLKPGMTADLLIRTAQREDVLTLPEDAVLEENGKKFVQILLNGKTEKKEIEIGLEGTNDVLEIISGLEEGEKVILP